MNFITNSKSLLRENTMSYIQENLMLNEKIQFSARVHPAIFIQSAVAFAGCIIFIVYAIIQAMQNDPMSGIFAGFLLLMSVAFFFASIILGLEALISILTTEFAVTNRRVIAKTDLVRRHTLEMLLPKIESVAVRQTVLGRIFNFGTVTVTGTGGTKESFRAIGEPIAVRTKINRIIENNIQAHPQFQQQGSTNQ
jgi:uncharacterized membrane protein YdbT with pleckstrin-like domain